MPLSTPSSAQPQPRSSLVSRGAALSGASDQGATRMRETVQLAPDVVPPPPGSKTNTRISQHSSATVPTSMEVPKTVVGRAVAPPKPSE